MITFEIFRGIQNPLQWWGFKGVFLITFFVIIVITALLMMVVSSIFAKITIVLIMSILSILLRVASEKYGVRGIKQLIGGKFQPKLIFVVSPRFSFQVKDIESKNIKNDIQTS